MWGFLHILISRMGPKWGTWCEMTHLRQMILVRPKQRSGSPLFWFVFWGWNKAFCSSAAPGGKGSFQLTLPGYSPALRGDRAGTQAGTGQEPCRKVPSGMLPLGSCSATFFFNPGPHNQGWHHPHRAKPSHINHQSRWFTHRYGYRWPLAETPPSQMTFGWIKLTEKKN